MKRHIVSLLLLLFYTSTAFSQTAQKPMILPFQEPPGIDTWLLGQAYGNTTGAFRFGDRWYSAGQGLHFGLDFTTPCGSPLVAVADGTVAFVDNLNFGSAPHNVILRHEALGLTTLYGHLESRSPLTQGATIQQGDFVGYSGDPDGTCDSRPHLHLEIRSLDYRTAYNPIDYIDADWQALALIGSFSSRNVQMDLDNARQWQALDDQPAVAFGGRILNNYIAPYPPETTPPENPPIARQTRPINFSAPVSLRQLDGFGCCWENWWDPENPNQLFAIDGFAGQRAAIYAYDASTSRMMETVGTAPPPFYSPDHDLVVTPVGDLAQISNPETGDVWSVQTGGDVPSINSDNTRLLLVTSAGATIPGMSAPITSIYVSDIRGNDARLLLSEQGLGAMWLDADRLLLSWRSGPYTQLDVYNVSDDNRYTLGRWYRPRGMAIAPGGNRLMFYLPFQPEPSDTGIFWMDIAEGATLNRVDWFGAYRWRDANSIFYIPFEPESGSQRLMHYEVASSASSALITEASFAIMDGRWSVNADGSMILFRNAFDRNLWLMDIPTQ